MAEQTLEFHGPASLVLKAAEIYLGSSRTRIEAKYWTCGSDCAAEMEQPDTGPILTSLLYGGSDFAKSCQSQPLMCAFHHLGNGARSLGKNHVVLTYIGK
ncbi:hypothetical protein DPMN_020524 [Dreissena polymorpha]|uniref:Uncharacterized protein n=1 Tax=Dreissena polymorpha TaxID=45954 RepID=A0A9D4NKK3_DREPO|nr:hypothetical protein DPMN_020524 [Dreissena polymorpha]